MTRWTAIIALPFSACLWAQSAELITVPDTIAAGDDFAVLVAGSFSSPCDLASEEVNAALETGGARPRLTIDLVQRDDIACPAVVVQDRQAYGPFQLDPALSAGVTVDIQLRTSAPGLAPRLLAETQMTLAESGSPPALIQPGVYWDPRFAGHGVAIDRQGDQLFAVLFSYGNDGQPVWLTGEGAGGQAMNWHQFNGGGCLTCSDRVALPVPMVIDTLPGFFLASGRHGALFTPGPGPARALILQPFSQAMVDSEGTIAGDTFPVPDWTGQWLFAFLDSSDGNRIVDLALVPSGISDSGQAVFESANAEVRIVCGEFRPERIRCNLSVDGAEVGVAPLEDLAHHQMFFESVIGTRLD